MCDAKAGKKGDDDDEELKQQNEIDAHTFLRHKREREKLRPNGEQLCKTERINPIAFS